mmetsp:Transcript_23653/g.37983  ORF Transcript_23653/g.37983 Transcript_23653/m.37983 type:complete len:136 (-) Transcript_23653:130-537(-)
MTIEPSIQRSHGCFRELNAIVSSSSNADDPLPLYAAATSQEKQRELWIKNTKLDQSIVSCLEKRGRMNKYSKEEDSKAAKDAAYLYSKIRTFRRSSVERGENGSLPSQHSHRTSMQRWRHRLDGQGSCKNVCSIS